MNREVPSLDDLGIRFGTDKSSRTHDYLSFYEFFFEKMRQEPVIVLEVGILSGASLRLWKEYFLHGTIIGADIDPARMFRAERIVTEIADQSNLEDLTRLGVKHGPFDIIIEDGSHLWEHQITTFKTLFPFLKNGGYYIAEDLHTNFGHLAAHYRGNSSISFVEYSKRLLDLRVADEELDILNVEDAFLRTYGRNVEHVTYYRRACLLRKRYKPKTDISDAPLAEYPEGLDERAQPLSMLCHIGHVGNRNSSSGALKVLRHDGNIQGFIVFAEAPISNHLEWRARLSDGIWTDWVGGKTYVGTTGQSLDLTGFSARLSPGLEDDYTMELAGLFRGQAETVRVEGGEDCVGSEFSQLYGMQISIWSRT